MASEDPRDGGASAEADVVVRTFLIADVRGYTRFTTNGDITPAAFTVFRITGSAERAPDLPEGMGGTVVDRVVRVATDLGQR